MADEPVFELPWDNVESDTSLTPRVHVHYASSISNLGAVANKNVILHRMRKQIKFVKSHDPSGTRVCIVSDAFNNADKLTISNGILFVATDPTTAGDMGVHLLIYPTPEDTSADDITLKRNLAREFNLASITSMLEGNRPWVPVSFWKVMGDEGRGKIECRPPSTKVTIFTPSSHPYAPEPSMNEFLVKGVSNLWGELAADTLHPSYKRMSEMR